MPDELTPQLTDTPAGVREHKVCEKSERYREEARWGESHCWLPVTRNESQGERNEH
jgi:hypothetical protein